MARLPCQLVQSLSTVSLATPMPPASERATFAHPLALRLRSLRQQLGSASLGQAQREVAAQVGIHVRHMQALETMRKIPKSLRTWLALCAALNCSIGDLVAPEPDGTAFVVLLCRTHGHVAMCFEQHRVVEVRQRSTNHVDRAAAMSAAERLAVDYGARLIVTDVAAIPDKNLAIAVVDLHDVGCRVGLHQPRPAQLAQYALQRLPMLARFVKLLPATGALSRCDRRGQLLLVAAAIGLAYMDAEPNGGMRQLLLPFET